MKNRESNPFPALFAFAGAALVVGGSWWIYRPAGLILAGTLLVAFGFFGRRGAL